MKFKKKQIEFINTIITDPNNAFTNTKKREELKNYLKYFFYNEITNETFNPNLSDNDLKTLKIRTYCYLLNAKGYDELALIDCLNNVNLETLKNMLNEGEISDEGGVLIQITEPPTEEVLLNSLLRDWKSLESLVGIYYKFLIDAYKKFNRKIDRIIVYEAPPFGKDHFFKTGGKYLTSFTFPKDSKLVLKEFDNLRISFLHPIAQKTHLKIHPLKYSIQTLIEENYQTAEYIKEAIKSGIVYIDLTMIPLPLTSDIRREWSINKKYLYGDKQLPVLMLEWALEKLKSRFVKGGITNPFSPTCQIAIGTPINTSASIFEYYSNTLLKIDEAVYFDLGTVNSPEVFKKKPYLKGYTLKQFKFNVIDNISPTWRFVHNAFDFPE
jgi:hypothetical protein